MWVCACGIGIAQKKALKYFRTATVHLHIVKMKLDKNSEIILLPYNKG